jgi:hypothetical protein
VGNNEVLVTKKRGGLNLAQCFVQENRSKIRLVGKTCDQKQPIRHNKLKL